MGLNSFLTSHFTLTITFTLNLTFILKLNLIKTHTDRTSRQVVLIRSENLSTVFKPKYLTFQKEVSGFYGGRPPEGLCMCPQVVFRT